MEQVLWLVGELFGTVYVIYRISWLIMFEDDFNETLKVLSSGEFVERKFWHYLLTSLNDVQKLQLQKCAVEIAKKHFGNGIYVRGLIEISSYCRNNCFYCGLRCSNNNAERYRLSKEDILNCCAEGARLGLNTFVLQGGEDPMQNDEWIADVVRSIKWNYPDRAVTLSVGERSRTAFRAFREAGVDRYLLRHETRNDEHYNFLHPGTMNAQKRRDCLFALKELGFQTGSGMMIGSPGQTVEHLIDDLQFLESLQPEMIGVGPFIPATGTPFEKYSHGSVDMTILIVSLLRLRFPKALIPATTALATLGERGREKAILAGANVIMPNLTPINIRDKYSIYDNKANRGGESAQNLQLLKNRLATIGYNINYGRGDYEL